MSGTDLLPGRGEWINGVNCSPAMKLWRANKLAELLDKLYSGVDSLGDRGRSVNYRDGDELQALINKLESQQAMCENGVGLGGRKIFTVPYSKWD
jgi:hypothetical protein